MDIINDLKKMQEKLSMLPPCPKRIEATKEIYYVLEREYSNLYGEFECKRIGFFQGIQLWLQDDFSEWTEEDKVKGFKAIY